MSIQEFSTIYQVRHGQSEANENGIFGLDTRLTPKGIEDARQLASELKSIHFDSIYSSDLIRAKQTAEIIAQTRQMPVYTNPSLRELDFGCIEGMKIEDVKKQFGEVFGRMKEMTDQERRVYQVVPDMETEESAVERYLSVLKEITRENLGRAALVVSHQTIMRLLLVNLGFSTYKELGDGSIPNLGYFVVQGDQEKFSATDATKIKKQESWF